MTYTVQIKSNAAERPARSARKSGDGWFTEPGLSNVSDVRIGKHIDLQIDAADKEAARSAAEEAAKNCSQSGHGSV